MNIALEIEENEKKNKNYLKEFKGWLQKRG